MLRRAAFTVFHRVRPGDRLLAEWSRAERFQWLEPERIREVQSSRLASLLADARSFVPHYRALLADQDPANVARPGAGGAWDSVPTLAKPDIRRAPDSFLSEAPGSRPLANATSGSTGESLRFYLDAAARFGRAASTHRFHRWAGIEPWDRHAKLWGARFDAPEDGLRHRLTNFLHPQLFLSSYEMSDERVREYIARLVEFQPRGLTSYPSPLEHFATVWPDPAADLPRLRAIICSAEQMHDHQRRLFEEKFGCPVFDRYGSREFGNIAQECEAHEGLHVAADRLLVEVVDGDGVRVPDGESGEIAITDLGNRAMPFIRYRTGDRGRLLAGRCRCGRTLPRLDRIEGRVLELIRAPGGVVISGTFWPQIIKQASARVRLFQVVQEDERSILMRLVMEPEGELEESERQALLRRVHETAPALQVRFEYVDDIPLTPGGKRRMVIGLGTGVGR